jgi:limonene-1,2-epoxide hydrolase
VRWLRACVLLFVLALTAGCGGGPPSAESVVRAWSQALNVDDNNTAASLFAPDAKVVQLGHVITLRTHNDALAWNTALPCSGKILSIHSSGQTATATFLLGNRQHSHCDGPGQHATAIFKVVHGKIVLWHQTGPGAAPAPSV